MSNLFYHCPKCGKNWSLRNTHPDCDALPADMVAQAPPPTAFDWVNVSLAGLVVLASYVVLYSFSPWLLLLPAVYCLMDLICAGSFTHIENWWAVKIADLLRGKVGGL